MWLAERTEREPGARLKVAEAFRDYEDYCKGLGAHSGTAMTFSRAMTARGIKRAADTAVRRFVGLRLRPRVGTSFDDDDSTSLV
jgi:hypothetical protein